jgi:hypothetical protein
VTNSPLSETKVEIHPKDPKNHCNVSQPEKKERKIVVPGAALRMKFRNTLQEPYLLGNEETIKIQPECL